VQVSFIPPEAAGALHEPVSGKEICQLTIIAPARLNIAGEAIFLGIWWAKL
jgi:hypothetical protein